MGGSAEQIKRDPIGAIVNIGTQISTAGVGGTHGNNNGLANVATQAGTLGLVGYDGKFEAGAVTRGVGEAYGEISGRNLARDEQAAAQARIAAENAQRVQDMADANERNRINDINASMSARGIRNTVAARNGAAVGGVGFSSTLGSDEKDFLGL